MRSEIRAEVIAVDPFDELEHEHIAEVLGWIDSNGELCRIEKPATPPKHLVSYFVITDGSHLLLGDHKKAQLWLPTGGHVEPGEHPRQTVVRELRDELGMELTHSLAPPLMVTHAVTVGSTPGHTDVCLWYLVKADRSELRYFDADEYRTVQWFAFKEAPVSQSDPHLSRFLRKLALHRFAK